LDLKKKNSALLFTVDNEKKLLAVIMPFTDDAPEIDD
jgi:hypothetical protein